jgi:hypothetical protein
MKIKRIIGDLWDRRLACPRARTGEMPIPKGLPDLIFSFYAPTEITGLAVQGIFQ